MQAAKAEIIYFIVSFLWDCHQLVGNYPSPATVMRKETNVNMETNMEMETNVNMQTNMDMEKNMIRCLT